MKTILICSFLFFVVTVFSCKSTKKALTSEEIQKLPKILAYSSSACYGRCPYFEMTIYKDGWVIFEGKRFTNHEGIATSKLTKAQLNQLTDDCQKADLWNCQSEYGMMVQDLPTVSIHFFEKNRDKQVKWKMNPPQSVADLSNKIMEIPYRQGWIESSKKPNTKGTTLPAGTIDNELIVKFKEPASMEEWVKKYERFGLKMLKSLSDDKTTYLVTFDTGQMTPKKMLEIVQKDSQVAEAEFNKRVTIR